MAILNGDTRAFSIPRLPLSRRSRRGASTIGNGLLIALIALGSIGAIAMAGDETARLFGAASNSLAGLTGEEAETGNRAPSVPDVMLAGDISLGESRAVAPGELFAGAF